MRVFYVVYITDERARACVDAIRHLCNPRNKVSAHITVRGPYKQRYNVKHLSSQVDGCEVAITGAGYFFERKQNTVFFDCVSSCLRQVWHKPKYPAYHPHITVYDGESRAFANKLSEILSKHKYNVRFRADGLTPLISVPDTGHLSLRYTFDAAFISNVVGERVNLHQIHSTHEVKKLEWIDRICLYLSCLGNDAGECERGTNRDRIAVSSVSTTEGLPQHPSATNTLGPRVHPVPPVYPSE